MPTAHLSLTDPAAAAAELERAVGEGAKGGYVAPFTHDGRPLGHPDNHAVFAAAQDLDVPLAIHPTFEPQWTKGTRMGTWENVKQLRLLASVQASDGVRHQFTTLFDYGVFDAFPRLKVVVLESGGGWIGYWLDRMDAVYGHTFIGERVPLQHRPTDYFRERVWISCDPDERTIPALAERYGVERFLWASDFPHADHTPEYIDDLNELVASFPEPGSRPVRRRQRPRAVQAVRSRSGRRERVVLVGHDPATGLLAQSDGQAQPPVRLLLQFLRHPAAQQGMREGDVVASGHGQFDDLERRRLVAAIRRMAATWGDRHRCRVPPPGEEVRRTSRCRWRGPPTRRRGLRRAPHRPTARSGRGFPCHRSYRSDVGRPADSSPVPHFAS